MKIIEVPVDSLQLSKWDIRRTADTGEEFESLKENIQENRLIYPITVARMKDDELIVIAGRRRLRAIKELGWNNVPVLIQFENVSETQLRKITFDENVHRKGLGDIEKGFGILAQFEPEGYTPDQVIEGVKSIDNWFHDYNNNKTDWNKFHKCVMESSTKQASPLRLDKKFAGLCQSVGLSPKYQYQLMQIVVQLHPEILAKAQNAGLNTSKKLLLTHSKLKDHPKIQEQLIPKIQHETDNNAKLIVRQKIEDLETGYIKKDGEGYTVSGKGKEAREKITSRPETERKSHYLPLMDLSHKMIYLLTGRRLTKGEHKYTKEIVDNNKEHRYKIVKSFDGDMRELNSLHDSMELVQTAVNDILEIIDSELDVAVQKKEMTRK